jgi:type IV pilus assembly protein PilE
MRTPGFTLVEVAVVLAVLAVLVTVTVPSAMGSLNKARRSDAVAALTRVQVAQERFRALHGSYTSQRQSLIGAAAARSENGHYEIQLLSAQPDRYEASASARADGPQARDSECQQLTLRVQDGIAEFGPSARCWNR